MVTRQVHAGTSLPLTRSEVWRIFRERFPGVPLGVGYDWGTPRPHAVTTAPVEAVLVTWDGGPTVAEVHASLGDACAPMVCERYGGVGNARRARRSLEPWLGPQVVTLRQRGAGRTHLATLRIAPPFRSLPFGGRPLPEAVDDVMHGAPVPRPTMAEIAVWVLHADPSVRLAGQRMRAVLARAEPAPHPPTGTIRA